MADMADIANMADITNIHYIEVEKYVPDPNDSVHYYIHKPHKLKMIKHYYKIPVVNNKIISIGSPGEGANAQISSHWPFSWLTGNPEIIFFERGSKYLWNDQFYHTDCSYKVRSDDLPIDKITELTGNIQYNPHDINVNYSPYSMKYKEKNDMQNTVFQYQGIVEDNIQTI